MILKPNPAMNNDKPQPQPKTRTRAPRKPSPNFNAQEKAQAVLAVWTERAKPAEVCRQLHINWITFQQWQRRAMEGMLQALEPRVNLAQGQALSPRLRSLLLQQQRTASLDKLSAKLDQLTKLAPKPDSAQKAG
jgi:transposase-like protein